MIRLLTGNPGAGKTLRAVYYIVEAVKAGRPVFVANLKGLVPEAGATVIDSPDAWQDFPDGSLVVVDEVQEFWKQGAPGNVPDYIEKLSTHRHRGFDFILMTQHPTMVHSWVRKLVGEHEHLVRQFNLQASKVVRWLEAHDDPKSQALRERGTSELWVFPKDLYQLYKSSTMHTMKARLPLKMKVLPVIVVVVAVLAWWAYKSVTDLAGTNVVSDIETGIAGNPVSAGGSGSRSAKSVKFVDAADYAEQHTPRIPAKPWTAPIFDERSAVSEPELYCIASETLRCICHTEQGTKYQVELRQCLAIVHGGGTYNPYRKPMKQDSTDSRTERDKPVAAAVGADEDRPGIRYRDVPKYPVQSIRSFSAIATESLARSSAQSQ